MKWLALPVVWLMAIALGVVVIWRLRRKERVLLRGRWSPALVQRVAAVVVVITGMGLGGLPEAGAQEAPNPKKGPLDLAEDRLPTLSPQALAGYRRATGKDSRIQAFKAAFAPIEGTKGSVDAQALATAQAAARSVHAPLRSLVTADLTARGAGRPLSPVEPAKVVAAIDALSGQGVFDPWIAGYLWRLTSRRTEPIGRAADVALFARLRRYARLSNVLIRARGRIKAAQFEPRAWMSKAGPSRELRQRESRIRMQLLGAAKALWPTTDTGTWERDATLDLNLPAGSTLTLLRGSGGQTPKGTLRLTRLDLLRSAAALDVEHAWLGTIRLPARRVFSVWELPALLSKEQRGRVKAVVQKALSGDTQAAKQIESALPLAHACLRERLDLKPNMPGAPRLRTILTLFDDLLIRR
jgi:hypothetical protein